MEKGYNLNEVANLLGITYRTARQWIYDGKIKASKIPGTRRWLVMADEVKRLQGGNADDKV